MAVGPYRRQRSNVHLKVAEFWTDDLKAGVLYVTFAAFDAFFKSDGAAPKVGLEILPKVIADATALLLRQEYSELVDIWAEANLEDCERAKDGSTKRELVAHLDRYIQSQIPNGERPDTAARDAAIDVSFATGIAHGRTGRLRRIASGKYVKIKVASCESVPSYRQQACQQTVQHHEFENVRAKMLFTLNGHANKQCLAS